MSVFEIRDKLISDYATFVTSYINIRDLKIKEHVEHSLVSGVLWPDPLVNTTAT